MYIIDLFKKMFRKANVFVLIYLVLNVALIGTLLLLLLDGDFSGRSALVAYSAGLALYAVSLAIALTPFGEWILRLQTGCKKINRVEQAEFLEPLFQEVLEKARERDPMLPQKVKLFIKADDAPNAFATGRRTICVTTGMLEMPQEQIKAALAHECGHLSNHDTDLILLVCVGNLVVTVLLAIIRLLLAIYSFVASFLATLFDIGQSLGLFMMILMTFLKVFILVMNVIHYVLSNVVLCVFSWLWTKLGVLLVMKSSRNNEFEADSCAYDLGYGNALCQLLDSLEAAPKAEGLFATLASSHPDRDDRIAKLQQLGATYRKVYGSKEN